MNPGALADVHEGFELPAMEVPRMSRDLLARFAEASGDHNPIHLDPAAAQSAGLDGVIAHGMLSAAYLARMVTEWAGPERLVTFAVRFVAPTPVDKQPRCAGRVVSVNEADGCRWARVVATMRLANGTVTARADARVRLDDGARTGPGRTGRGPTGPGGA